MQDIADWVVFFANGYGDTLSARPALYALAHSLPGRKTLICHRGAHFLIHDLGFDEIVAVDMLRGADGREFDVAALVGRLQRGGGFVAAVPWATASLRRLKSALEPRLSVGHFADYDIHVPFDAAINTIELTFRLASLFGEAKGRAPRRPPQFSDPICAYVDSLLEPLPADAVKWALHFDTAPAKMWNDADWRATLALFFSSRPNHFGLIVGSHATDTVPQDVSAQIVPLLGLPIEAAMRLVSRCDAFAGVNSCMLHVADAHLIPGVALFKSTNPAEFGFYYANSVHVDLAVEPEDAVARFAAAMARVETFIGARDSTERPDASLSNDVSLSQD